MRISRRTSGGRGEYEISEAFQDVLPLHLIGRRLHIDFGVGWVLDTGTVLRHQGGKSRIRLSDGTIQLPRQFAAALLMPRPVRSDDALGRGQPILKSDRYAIEHLHIQEVRLQGDSDVTLRINDVELRNADLHAETFSVDRRAREVRRVLANAASLPGELQGLLEDVEELLLPGNPLTVAAEDAVARIATSLTELGPDLGIFRQGGEDAMPDLLRTLLLAEEPPEPPIHVDEVDPEEIEIKRRTAREWKRWASGRGARSAKFRAEVREAYRWTCIVCGARYSRTSFNRVAGVDGAHILPWADYNLDHVSNGLSLCRTHHWAFDEGLITLRWDTEQQEYCVGVPPEASRVLFEEDPQFSLDSLAQHVGPVPESRLPSDPNLRPRPEFLNLLYDLYHRL